MGGAVVDRHARPEFVVEGDGRLARADARCVEEGRAMRRGEEHGRRNQRARAQLIEFRVIVEVVQDAPDEGVSSLVRLPVDDRKSRRGQRQHHRHRHRRYPQQPAEPSPHPAPPEIRTLARSARMSVSCAYSDPNSTIFRMYITMPIPVR